jgi:hypothetical protein
MPSMVVCPECHSPIVFGGRGKTVTRSFRVDEEALSALEEEAARRNVSVNTFLNQQILSFTRYDRFFLRIGLVKYSANTLRLLIDAASDETIVEAARLAALDTPRAIIMSKYGQVTLETTLEYVKMLAEFGNMYEYSISKSPSGTVITLSHRFGAKGSLYYSSYVRTLFEQINYTLKIKSSTHSVDFEILPRKDDGSRPLRQPSDKTSTYESSKY